MINRQNYFVFALHFGEPLVNLTFDNRQRCIAEQIAHEQFTNAREVMSE